MPRDVSFVFDPFEIAGVDKANFSADARERVLEEVADLVLNQVKADTAKGISPVYGDKFEALSPDYKKFKIAQGRGGAPNLRFDGDMIEAVKIEKQGDFLRIFVEDSQSDKADGHNDHSGESTLPLRRFIPKFDEDDGWSDRITKKITQTVKGAEEESIRQIIEEGLTVRTTGTFEPE